MAGVTTEEVSNLKQAVESQHGGTATFVQSVPIREMHGEQLVWEGTVHIFDLEGHPKTTRAYAWSHAIDGNSKRKFFAVLGIPPITGPREAVRAAIVAEARAEK